MKGRVEHDGRFTTISLDWSKMVLKPAQEGYFQEAFASADALIDDAAESVLRAIYNSNEAQGLINELHKLRGRVNFDGIAVFSVLKNKGALENALLEDVRKFKKARDLVLHNVEAEYKLIDYGERSKMDQAGLDTEAHRRAMDGLSLAFTIFNKLMDFKGTSQKLKN